MWGFTAIERTAKDTRHAVRQLVRRPGWTLTVLMTLALGLGANTSIFALVDAMLFRPAPGQRPEQLVWVAIMEGQSGHIRATSYPVYTDLRDRTTTMSGVLAYGGTSFSVGGERAERVYGNLASGNYFDVLGIPAAIGRTFSAEEDTVPGAHPVVVLSDRLWRRRFSADTHVVGIERGDQWPSVHDHRHRAGRVRGRRAGRERRTVGADGDATPGDAVRAGSTDRQGRRVAARRRPTCATTRRSSTPTWRCERSRSRPSPTSSRKTSVWRG